jgi:hypothetical protein
MSIDTRSKTGSADSHTDDNAKSGGIGDAGKEKLTKLADRGSPDSRTSSSNGEGDDAGRHEAPDSDKSPQAEAWTGDPLSTDRPDIPEGQRPDEPPARVEAPKYQGPSYRTDADLDDLLDRSPEHHAAMITGEFQAGHRYPHNKNHSPV